MTPYPRARLGCCGQLSALWQVRYIARCDSIPSAPFVPLPRWPTGWRAVPYDVVNRDEARRWRGAIRYSFLHVGRSDIDLPDGRGPARPADLRPGARGARPVPGRGHPAARGGAVALPLSPDHGRPGADRRGRLRAHRRLRARRHPEAREDPAGQGGRPHPARARRSAPTRSRCSSTYRGPAGDRRAGPSRSWRPRRSTTSPRPTGCGTPSGGSPTPGRSLDAFRAVPYAYVADGHHRSASAWRAGQGAAGQAPGSIGATGSTTGFWPCCSRPTQLRILPYNRVVRDLAGLGAGAGARPAVAASGRVTVTDDSDPAAAGQLLLLPGRPLVPARARRGDDRPERSDRLARRVAAAGPGARARSSASATRAPTSGSTSWAASGARRSWSGGCDSGEMAIAFSLYPDDAGAAHGGRPTRARSCRPRAPGSSPSCGAGSSCIPCRLTEPGGAASHEGSDRGQVREGRASTGSRSSAARSSRSRT